MSGEMTKYQVSLIKKIELKKQKTFYESPKNLNEKQNKIVKLGKMSKQTQKKKKNQQNEGIRKRISYIKV